MGFVVYSSFYLRSSTFLTFHHSCTTALSLVNFRWNIEGKLISNFFSYTLSSNGIFSPEIFHLSIPDIYRDITNNVDNETGQFASHPSNIEKYLLLFHSFRLHYDIIIIIFFLRIIMIFSESLLITFHFHFANSFQRIKCHIIRLVISLLQKCTRRCSPSQDKERNYENDWIFFLAYVTHEERKILKFTPGEKPICFDGSLNECERPYGH